MKAETSCHVDLRKFWQMLAEGAYSGEQVLSALRSIQDALPPEPMGKVVAALARDVESGNILSEAMKKHPTVFTKAHVCLVQGGEYVGRLDRILLLIMEFTWACPACSGLKFPGPTESS